jgi:ABC-type dipeptide/oligopeptide/nickel transport system permease component
MLQLSKEDRELLHNVIHFRIVAISLIFLGIAGIGLGIYSIWVRPMMRDAMGLVVTLILYSIGYIVIGWILNKICQVLQKINEQI